MSIRLGPLTISHRVILVLILLAAACVRFAGSTWGANHYLHPDERFMTMVTLGIGWPTTAASYFDSATSPLNPYNTGFEAYVYGTLPLFLTKALGVVTGDIVYGDAHLPGRWLSAVADTGTVAIVYWIAQRIFTARAGLIAAVLLAFAPLHIQTAHYYTTDSVATFLVVAAFAASLKAADTRRWRWFAVAGMCVGLAAASKPNLAVTAGFLLLPTLEAIRLRGIRSVVPRWRWWRGTLQPPEAIGTAVAVLTAFLGFRIAQPYAFAGPHPWSIRLDPRWTSTLDYWRQVQSGHIDVPPSVQWADRTPLVYVLDNLVRWGMGPALGIVALTALVVYGSQLVLGRRWPNWWLLAIIIWTAFHVTYYGAGFVKAQRYLLPAYPFLIVLAAAFLDSLPGRIRAWTGTRAPSPTAIRRVQVGVIIVVIAGTVVSGLALTTIYLRPQTRVEASAWIYAHVPAGSTIATESWDDGLPLLLPGEPTDAYHSIQIAGYDADTDAKLSKLIGQLQQADYIVQSSDRLRGSIPRMPDRYPMMTAYYRALASGELGFEQVATFASPPSLFGVTFGDRNAEESLTVYDHPYVTIYRKSAAWSVHDAWYLLDAALGDGGVQRRVIDPAASLLMLDEPDRDAVADGSDWPAWVNSSRNQVTMAIVWYLVLQVLTVPAIPVMWRLLPALPDCGYAVAKTVGLFGVAWMAWILASLRLVPFGPASMLIASTIAVFVGVLAVRGRAQPMLADLRERWRWLVAAECVYLLSFLSALWLRAQNPDLWNPWRGGEKPMELAYFSAILRSSWFPPYDPWLAGGVMHYYYFGYLPWAMFSRITGAVPEVAFNLALPSLFGLLMVNIWIAAAALIARFHARKLDSRQTWITILLALVAPILVGLAGNLDIVRRLGRGEWGGDQPPALLDRLGGIGAIAWGIRNVLAGSGELPVNAYWDTTRVIPDTINEFPYFSFLFGDLHAHVLAMPVVAALIVVAIGIATDTGVDTSERPLATIGGWRRGVAVAVLTGFLAGVLLASNPWDFPAAVVLAVVAGAVRAVATTGRNAPWRLVRDVAIYAVAIVAVSRLLFQPFLAHYGSMTPQLFPATETTLLEDFLTIHGAMLTVFSVWLFVEAGRSCAQIAGSSRRGRVVSVLIAAGLVGALAMAVRAGDTSLFLVAMILVILVTAAGRIRDPAQLVLLAMAGLALTMGLFAEHYRFWNDSGRMNLVFKWYLHAWQLLGLSAAVAMVLIAGRIARAEVHREVAGRSGPFIPPALASRVWLAVVAVAMAGAISYPVVATGLRLGDRFAPLDPTLDGLAYMNRAVVTEMSPNGVSATFSLSGDGDAIVWLRQNIEGAPTVLEAQLPSYRWGGRVSSLTGLPSVLGWTFHEIQQRPGSATEIERRVVDIAEIYNSPHSFADIRPLLDRYDVELIYIGPLERTIYDPIGLAKFQTAVDTGDLAIAYVAGGVTIYRYGD